jgi:formylglycine-generating enzyme required for sulfatase activity
MAEKPFDPYYEWLGIPPREQPPNHYRLLGIALFEDHGTVIENAADRIIAQLRTYQAGKHSAQSQALLNEVTKAKLCLLKADKRAAYDEKLRASLEAAQPPDELDQVASIVQEIVVAEHQSQIGRQSQIGKQEPGASRWGLYATVGLVVVVAGAGGLWMWRGRARQEPVVVPQAVVISQPAATPDASASPVKPEPKPAIAEPSGDAQMVIAWPLDEREGAAVEIDGQFIDPATVSRNPASPTDVTVKLTPGRHAVRLMRKGFESYLTIAQGEPGKPHRVQPVWQPRPATADGHGLLAVIYEGEDFDSPQKERIDPIVDWMWGYGPPDRDFRNDDFSVRWTGWLKAPTPGTYELTVIAGNGMRVWLDDQQIIDAWSGQFLRPVSVKTDLTAKPQALRVDYHAAKGSALASLRWTLPDSNLMVPIPTQALFYDREVAEQAKVELTPEPPLILSTEDRPPNGLLAELFRGNTFEQLVTSRVDRRVDWFWGNGPPHPGMPASWYSIRWTGTLRPPKPGEYTLIIVSDDAARLFLDGNLLIDDFRRHGLSRRGRKLFLEDRPHELKYEYYSEGGVNACSLRWIPPEETIEVPIPDTALVPPGAAAGSATPVNQPQPGPVATTPTAMPPAAPAEGVKAPVPADAAIERARGLAQELFKQEYDQATTPEAKQTLAVKILDKSAAADMTVEDRYVLLRLARDVALAGDALPTTMAAVDKTAEYFTIDRWGEKAEILGKIAKRARTPEQIKALSTTILETLDQALADAAAAPAKELLHLAQATSARLRGKDKDLLQQVRARKDAVDECVRAADELEAARTALAANPNDPKAKRTLGAWQCFARGQWQVGLPLLSQGDSTELKALAEKELAATTPAGEDAERLADAWWDLSTHEKGQRKEHVVRHAAMWYRRALEGSVPADVRARVEKRLLAARSLAGRTAAPPAATAPFDAQQAVRHQQAWAEHLSVSVETGNSIGMKLVLIPPGQFMMGSSPEENKAALDWGQQTNKRGKYFDHVAGEQPQHLVRITRPFYIGAYEVTQAEYQKVMAANPSGFSAGGMNGDRVAGRDTSRCPVEMVSWNDAVAFCQRLSGLPDEKAARRVYRLLSEAEWEYACRAGTTTRWFHGDQEADFGRYGWCNYNASSMPHPVGSKEPNPWGLYDMLGNVNEWCLDYFSQNYYAQSPQADPAGPNRGGSRVRRGSGWATPLQSRSAARWSDGPESRNNGGGFRVGFAVP